MDRLKQDILELAQGLPPEWAVLFVAALPILELRGAIPLGFAMGLPPLQSFLLAVTGNLLPVPILLLMLDPIVAFSRRVPVLGRIVSVFRNRAAARRHEVDRLGWWGLVLFVAVPLPSTGAWTGAAIAALLGYPFRTGFSAIVIGVILAGMLVTILSHLGWALTS